MAKSGDGVVYLSESCTNLETLWLESAEHSLPPSCAYLIAAQKGLKGIYFGEMRLSNACLLGLPRQCPLLQEIDLFEVSGFTEAGIVRLVKACPHLRKLLISENAGGMTEKLKSRCHSVRPLVRLIFEEGDAPECWDCMRY